MPLTRRSSAPADVSAAFFAGVAPCTRKLAPGSASKLGKRFGSLIQSCAQATLPRKASTAFQLSRISLSKRAPSSPPEQPVLALDPIWRTTGSISRILPLRDDTFEAQLAGVMEDIRAV